jgi:DNA adenine methylase
MQPAIKKNQSLGGIFVTPLRYPGGKGRLGPWIAQILAKNKIIDGHYIEPYAGGAGAALFLLSEKIVRHITINDADPVVYSFWRAVTEFPSELVKLIESTPVNMETWHRQKEVVASPSAYSLLDVAFATFFLNRTNRSGILSAGVIGGKLQAGEYKLNARYNSKELCGRIESIGRMAGAITVLGKDALDLLDEIPERIGGNGLVYLDPPYYVKGSQLYRNHYSPEDHEAIARKVRLASYPCMVTYDDCSEIRGMYSKLKSSSFSLHYSTHKSRPVASEVLFYKNIKLPISPGMTRGRDYPIGGVVEATAN